MVFPTRDDVISTLSGMRPYLPSAATAWWVGGYLAYALTVMLVPVFALQVIPRPSIFIVLLQFWLVIQVVVLAAGLITGFPPWPVFLAGFVVGTVTLLALCLLALSQVTDKCSCVSEGSW
jgi:hypothetical protein